MAAGAAVRCHGRCYFNLGYSTFLVYPIGAHVQGQAPLAAAIVNTGGSLGGAFAPFVVGVVLDWASSDAVFLFLASTSLLTLLTVIEPARAAGLGRAPRSRPEPERAPPGSSAPHGAAAGLSERTPQQPAPRGIGRHSINFISRSDVQRVLWLPLGNRKLN